MSVFPSLPTSTATRVVALSVALLLAVLALAIAGPASALARGGGDDPPGDDNSGRGGGRDDVPAQPERRRRAEVRVVGSCGRGAKAKLKLKEDDGEIEAEFEIERTRSRRAWRIVIVHERRVEYRGRVRTNSRGWAQVNERLADLRGADAVLARAYGPGGITCTASAVLPGV